MNDKFVPVSTLLNKLVFDEKIENKESKINEYSEYILSEHSRVFCWEKKDADDKIHISDDALCGLFKGYKRYEKIDKIAVDENEYDNIISLVEKEKVNDEMISEIIRIYEKNDDIKIRRYDVRLTGKYSPEIKSTKGIIEIINVYDEVEIYQKSISKHIHDIKNQMMIMLSAANNIQNETEKTSIKKYAYFIKETVYSCNYMLSFINTNKNLNNNKKLFNIHHVIVSLMDTFRGEPEVKFSNILNADNPRVYANRVLITNVIYNVIINAIQAIEHKGNITLRTYNKSANDKTEYKWDKWLFIEIKDSGQGISDDVKDKIFDSCFTTKSGGSGLGLYSSKMTLAHHNGTIYVESKHGEGAVFTIALPCHIE